MSAMHGLDVAFQTAVFDQPPGCAPGVCAALHPATLCYAPGGSRKSPGTGGNRDWGRASEAQMLGQRARLEAVEHMGVSFFTAPPPPPPLTWCSFKHLPKGDPYDENTDQTYACRCIQPVKGSSHCDTEQRSEMPCH